MHVLWGCFLEAGGLTSSVSSKFMHGPGSCWVVSLSRNFFLQFCLCRSYFFKIHLWCSCSVSVIGWDVDKPDTVPVSEAPIGVHRNPSRVVGTTMEGGLRATGQGAGGRNSCSAGSPRPTRVPGSLCLPPGDSPGVHPCPRLLLPPLCSKAPTHGPGKTRQCWD